MYLPSGEYSGVESLPGFVVIFFGVPPADGHDEDVAVRASRLNLVDVAGVGDLFAVGRERVLVLASERERRNIVRSRRQIARHSSVSRKPGTGGCTCRQSSWSSDGT